MPDDMSKPSRPTAPLTPARMTAYCLAIVTGLLTSAVALAPQMAQLLVLLQFATLLLCALLCFREPFDGLDRFSPVFIALISLVLSAFVVPG